VSVAERADVIINFSNFEPGDKLVLVNRLVMQDEGFGPKVVAGKYEVLPEGKGDEILRFDVQGGDITDSPEIPTSLRAKPALPKVVEDAKAQAIASHDATPLKSLLNHREFKFGFDEINGDTWVVNKRPFDPSPAGTTIEGFRIGSLDTPRSGLPGQPFHDGEVWTIKNDSGSNWAHPIHIHLEEFQILLRNGNEPPEYEKCKKDVLRLDPKDEVQIYLRFRDLYGKYPIHCHNVLHEDHEMMLRFDVVGDY
jgi:FtsP/CotA-like multicopper oxidase with cupredoxin domain